MEVVGWLEELSLSNFSQYHEQQAWRRMPFFASPPPPPPPPPCSVAHIDLSYFRQKTAWDNTPFLVDVKT